MVLWFVQGHAELVGVGVETEVQKTVEVRTFANTAIRLLMCPLRRCHWFNVTGCSGYARWVEGLRGSIASTLYSRYVAKSGAGRLPILVNSGYRCLAGDAHERKQKPESELVAEARAD